MKKTLKTAYFLAILTTGLAGRCCFRPFSGVAQQDDAFCSGLPAGTATLYDGFGSIAGPIELVSLLSTAAVAVLIRGQRRRFLLALLASILIMIALVIWQLNNGPVNDAVDSWTISSVPPDWTAFRNQWEYAHATRAVLFIIALGTLVGSLLVYED